MHLSRRTLLGSGAAAVIAAAVTGCSPRGEDSGGNATMIVPFAPGGGSDQSGRALADGLEQALGNSISVENIQGGSAPSATPPSWACTATPVSCWPPRPP